MKRKGFMLWSFVLSMVLSGIGFSVPAFAQEQADVEKMVNLETDSKVDVSLVTYPDEPTEGIYYIINKASMCFLRTDDTQVITGPSGSQQWLLTKDETASSNHFYKMRNDASSGYLGGFKVPTEAATYIPMMVEEGDGRCCFHIKDTSSFTIRWNKVDDMYMLREDPNAFGEQKSTSWLLREDYDITPSDEWSFYKVNYSLGDVDRNGIVEYDDATMILQYVTNKNELTTVEKYLADINQDGKINTKDSLEIERRVVL